MVDICASADGSSDGSGSAADDFSPASARAPPNINNDSSPLPRMPRRRRHTQPPLALLCRFLVQAIVWIFVLGLAANLVLYSLERLVPSILGKAPAAAVKVVDGIVTMDLVDLFTDL